MTVVEGETDGVPAVLSGAHNGLVPRTNVQIDFCRSGARLAARNWAKFEKWRCVAGDVTP